LKNIKIIFNTLHRVSYNFNFFLSFNLLAHQPQLINYSPSENNPHQVIDPEISKACYAKLDGKPHYYQIDINEEFLFYDQFKNVLV